MINELKKYIKSFIMDDKCKKANYRKHDPKDNTYFFNMIPFSSDFCKEIHINDEMPAVDIMSDEGFFYEARLPLKFQSIDTREIVKVIWGKHYNNETEYTCLPDLGTEEFKKYEADKMLASWLKIENRNSTDEEIAKSLRFGTEDEYVSIKEHIGDENRWKNIMRLRKQIYGD